MCDSATTNVFPCAPCLRLKLDCVPPAANYEQNGAHKNARLGMQGVLGINNSMISSDEDLVIQTSTARDWDTQGPSHQIMACVPPNNSYCNGADLDTVNYLDKSNLPMMFILHSNLVPFARRTPNEHGEVLDDKGGVIGRVEVVPSSNTESQALSSPDSNPSIKFSEGMLSNASEGSFSFASVEKTLPYRNVLEDDPHELEGREPNEMGEVMDEDGDIIGRVEVVRGLVLVMNPKYHLRPVANRHNSGKLLPRKPHEREASKKPQCWDHGCNGREFTSFSALWSHQREEDGTPPKRTCPRCGATFPQAIAFLRHLAVDKCNSSQGNSGYNQDDPDADKKVEIAVSDEVASWSTTGPVFSFDARLVNGDDEPQLPDDGILRNPLHVDSKPPKQRHNDSRDSKSKSRPSDTKGQALSQSHTVAAPDNASANTIYPVEHPKLPPRPWPLPSASQDAKATQARSNASAEAIVEAFDAFYFNRHQITRGGEGTKEYGMSSARRENSSLPSGENGHSTRKDNSPTNDSPKDDSPKDDPPKDDSSKDKSPQKSAPYQIKGAILESSSTGTKSKKLPPRPKSTNKLPDNVHKMQSDFRQVNESSFHSQCNYLHARMFLAPPSSRVSRPQRVSPLDP